MNFIFQHFSTNTLEYARNILTFLLVAMGIFVFFGVKLEGGDYKTLKEKLGNRLLLFGLLVEPILSVAIWQVENVILVRQEATISQLSSKASSAERNANQAISDARSAGKRLRGLEEDESNLRAALDQDRELLRRERVARQAMLEQLKPRSLTRKQHAAIGDAVRGKVSDVYVYALADSEASDFAFELIDALEKGGLKVKLMTPLMQSWHFPMPVSGVTVWQPGPAGENAPAVVLVNALNTANLYVAGSFTDLPAEIHSPAIFVGLKPLPFQRFPTYLMSPELEKKIRLKPPAWDPK